MNAANAERVYILMSLVVGVSIATALIGALALLTYWEIKIERNLIPSHEADTATPLAIEDFTAP